MQWNYHSLLGKVESLRLLAQECDVLALSETWLCPDSHLTLPGFCIFRSDSLTRRSGGLLLALPVEPAGSQKLLSSTSDSLYTCINNAEATFLTLAQTSLNPKGGSCQDNLGILTAEIYVGFVSAQDTACLFLDVQGAFDNIVPDILVLDLVRLGLPPEVRWFVYCLTSRRILRFVINGDISQPYVSLRGVPQGSILSPLLFNIYVSECNRSLTDPCRILQFADNIVLYACTSRLRSSIQTLERSADGLSHFLLSKGLEVSPFNSAFMLFSQKRLDFPSLTITLQEITLRPVSSHKFLGVQLDRKMNGHAHVALLIRKCNKFTNLLRSLCGVWWGADPESLLMLYKSLVRGSIEYGYFFLPFYNRGLMGSLEVAQRRALRCYIGVRRSTSINILYPETGICPLKLRLIYLSSKLILRSLTFVSSPLIEGLLDLRAESLANNNRFCLYERFLLYRAFISVNHYGDSIARFTNNLVFLFTHDTLSLFPQTQVTPAWEVERIAGFSSPSVEFHIIFSRFDSDITFYTDASKGENSNFVGLAFYSPSLNVSQMFKASGRFSIFSAECMAITEAMDFILSNDIKRAVIFLDSLSVINKISSRKTYRDISFLVLILKNKLRSAFLQDIEINLVWIPAHVGIPGNETADRLAKKAIIEGRLLDIKPPYSDLYLSLRENLKTSTNNFLIERSRSTGSDYFWNFPLTPLKP
ncbi:uncharacterized protein [Anoplolepis gracilipes]|uniref:uncharacterized protein n=1 Tax=Anoplolepis gracilipes TaxID=354296 RepID=UPI003B9FA3E9